MPALKSLDLFSGMGGITHGLRGLGIEPVAYCEWDARPRELLENLMAAKLLPRAPIEPDVRKIASDKYKGVADVIVAGFPCIGVSSCGKREGFKNEQTGLFSEVIRLTRGIQPKFVFLENVKPIASFDKASGVKHVVRSLAPLGYELRWLIVSAYDVGAPQMRNRWFCLCVRKDVLASGFRLTQAPVKPFNWRAGQPAHRMAKSLTPLQRHFNRACGNGVCPDAVRTAFVLAFEGFKEQAADPSKLFAKRTLTLGQVEAVPHKGGDDYAKACVCSSAAAIKDAATQPTFPARARVDLTVANKYYKPPRGTELQNNLPAVRKPQHATLWPTPRAGNAVHAANVLTERCMRDIGTMLRFERSTKDSERSGLVAPEFLAWLMGYSQAWCKAATKSS